jgi:hypothetical protein
VRNIGDRHDQAETLALALAIHGIVEVPRRLAVDGHQRQAGHVLAALPVRFAHGIGQLLRFGQSGRGKLVRQFMLAQRDLDFHAGIGIVAEHLDQAPDRLAVLARLLDQFDHHHLAGLRLERLLRALLGRRQQDVLADALVLGRDETHAVFLDHSPHHEAVGPLRDFNDLALGTAFAIDADDPGDDLVAMQHLVHFLGGKEQVATATFRRQEAVAVRMPGHAPAHQVRLVRNQPVAAPVLHQLRFARHGAQPALERLQLEGLDVEQPGEALEFQRRPLGCQGFQDVLATRQGMLVLGLFTLELGVGATHFGKCCGLMRLV